MSSIDAQTSETFAEWASACDLAIREGRIQEARDRINSRISNLGQAPLTRSQMPELAELCRRAGLYLQSISLLHPYVRPKARDPVTPTLLEKVEYAGALAQVGAESEALAILRPILDHGPPRALLFAAFAHFSRWEYGLAIPLLRRFVAHPELTPYQRWTGNVNLVASLVIERRSQEASALLSELLAQVPAQNTLLLSNLLEIAAQHELYQRNFPQARERLNQAAEVVSKAGSQDRFFLNKWRVILDALSARADLNPGPDQSTSQTLAKFAALRDEAHSRSHWETLRECDLYQGLALGQRLTSDKSYYGTPYPKYRERIQIESNADFKKSSYDWAPLQTGPVLLDLTRPKNRKLGQVVDRTLTVLASDFYRPHHWASLHAQLFPDRHLNPESSPSVIHQAIKRTRGWLKKYAPSVEIVENLSRYSLVTSRAGTIRVRTVYLSATQARLEILRKKGPRDFSVHEIIQIWKMEKHTAIRLLNQLIGENLVRRTGVGRATRYQIV